MKKLSSSFVLAGVLVAVSGCGESVTHNNKGTSYEKTNGDRSGQVEHAVGRYRGDVINLLEDGELVLKAKTQYLSPDDARTLVDTFCETGDIEFPEGQEFFYYTLRGNDRVAGLDDWNTAARDTVVFQENGEMAFSLNREEIDSARTAEAINEFIDNGTVPDRANVVEPTNP